MAEIDKVKLMADLRSFMVQSNKEDKDEFCASLVNVHLTHQQKIGAFSHSLLKALRKYPNTDLRNKATKNWAKYCIDGHIDGDDWYFPFI
jgi:hypothetical protein